jgi:hypothetical protein
MLTPITKQLPLLFLSISILNGKHLKWKYVFASFLTIYFVFYYLIFSIKGLNVDVLSLMLAWLTWLVLALTPIKRLYERHEIFLKYTCFTVIVAILLSVLSSMGVLIFEVRTNTVFLIDRLTFLFEEPSHYSIFLAFAIFCAGFNQSNKITLFILYMGLLLTWSLSGFAFLLLVYFLHNLSMKTIIKSVTLITITILTMYFFWHYYLADSGFWLSDKIKSLLSILSGDMVASSALYRTQSTLMGFQFLIDNWANSDYFTFFFGTGFGNLNMWVENHYYVNFGITGITEVNNFITSIIINSGVLGLFFFFSAVLLVVDSNTPSAYGYMLTCILLSLSLFSGYAFGGIALLYFLLAMIAAISLAKCRLLKV